MVCHVNLDNIQTMQIIVLGLLEMLKKLCHGVPPVEESDCCLTDKVTVTGEKY